MVKIISRTIKWLAKKEIEKLIFINIINHTIIIN